jgi:FdhD protein
VVEIAIAAQSASRHAFNRRQFDQRKRIRLAAVVPDKIVAGRNVKMTDFHRHNDIIGVESMKADGIGPGQIIRRRADGNLEYQHDELTIEEPLEIRIGKKIIATTMRTPGHDEELAAGFLLSEGIVRDRDQITKFSRPDAARNRENIVIVDFAEGVTVKLNAAQRFGTISSSCGLCGKESIDAIRQNFAPISSTALRIEIRTLLSLPQLLHEHQSDFARTGGIHAAGIFDSTGKPLIVREDIGRHNAVDKTIGRAFIDEQLPLDRYILLVSGRASFEIMQKALAAGIPMVASVSAPSSLAMEFARENNQTLIGFLRPPSFNIYSHVERVILEQNL